MSDAEKERTAEREEGAELKLLAVQHEMEKQQIEEIRRREQLDLLQENKRQIEDVKRMQRINKQLEDVRI